jgi:hypothetical protein
MSRPLWTFRAATAFFLPDARVIGLVAAQLRQASRTSQPVLAVSATLIATLGIFCTTQ